MNKIEALRKAADLIESGHYYNWYSMSSCNCGILAQVVLNVEELDDYLDELDALFELDRESNSNGWSYLVETIPVCETTGLEIPYLLRVLLNAGFTPTEIEELENLSEESIRQKIGISPSDSFSNEYCVVPYFREKATRLEAQQFSNQRVKSNQQQSVPVQVNNI